MDLLIERNGVLGVECDGRFIPAISGGTGAEIALLAVAAVGAAAAAYGAYSQAQTAQDAAKTQAKIREEDAQVAEQAGRAAAERQRKKDRARMESFGARAGAAGVVAREGSSLLAELDYAEQSELEAQHVQYGYQLQARGQRVQAQYAKYTAGKINPEMAATTSLLSSAGSIAGSYSGSSTAGIGTAATQTGGGLREKPTGGTAGYGQDY